MWKIDKPELRRARGKDVREVIAHCKDLDETVREPLKQLYQEYDKQEGYVTDAQLGAITKEQAKAIHDMYSYTYEGRSLAYMRDELTAEVYKCPYCSINQPNTLDHYMPESVYPALAICRMNLVPMCGVCNDYKGTKPYRKFIHCYYEKLPVTGSFLLASVFAIRQRFVVRFSFDSGVIADPVLEAKLKYQENETRLFKRLRKESTVFIHTLCCDCELNDTASLKLWLGRRLMDKENEFGKNDWRCAVIRGMLAYPKLDIAQIKYNKMNPKRVSSGGE